MKILFRDSGRFLGSGGYSEFSRGLIFGFLTHRNEVKIPSDIYKRLASDFNQKLPYLNMFQQSEYDEIDVAITITNINSIPSPKRGVCNVLVTGSPFLGLIKGVKEKVAQYDSIFYSGAIDSINFSDVNGCDLPQPIDTVFKKQTISSLVGDPKYPLELLFVGTFNYWKGLDQTVKSFLKSELPARARLTLKCPLQKSNLSSLSAELLRAKHYELYISVLADYINEVTPSANVDIELIDPLLLRITITDLKKDDKIIDLDMRNSSRVEMQDIYARSDVLLHLSRGETWSMPVAEALYCGLVVIFPEHYGIKNVALDIPNSIIVPSREKPFDDFDFSIDRSSGGGRLYVGNNIKYFDVDTDEVATVIEKFALSKSENCIISQLMAQDRFNPLQVSSLFLAAINRIGVGEVNA